MQRLVPQRDEALEQELARQRTNERLRQTFASAANKLGPWLERTLDTLMATQTAPGLSLDNQASFYAKIEDEIGKIRPLVIDMERSYQVRLCLIS